MPQMKPNSAIVVATVTHVEIYSKQHDFSLLSLNVKSASQNGDDNFLFDQKKDADIKALVKNEEYISAHVKNNTIIKVVVKKVSIDMWRIIRFI